MAFNAVLSCVASWCGPCHMISPIFERLESIHSENAVFVKVYIPFHVNMLDLKSY